MDLLDELEKRATDPESALRVAYLANDVRSLLPLLADPRRAAGAVDILQKWSDAPGESLRKGFATAFIERARMALGGAAPEEAISRFAHPFAPGEASRVAAPERFQHQPLPKVNGGGDNVNKPAPRVEAETTPHGRMEAPGPQRHEFRGGGSTASPGTRRVADLLAGRSDKPNFTMGGHKPVSINAPPAAADAAHRSGARLASLSAKHAFALGAVAGGGLGLRAGRMLSDKQRAERRTAALARWKGRGQAQPAAPMGKMFPLKAGFHKIGLPTGNGLWSGKSGESCPTCGTMAKMAKGATPQPGTRVTDMSAAAQAIAATHVADPVTRPVPVDGKCPTCGAAWDGTEPQAASTPRQAPLSAGTPSTKATTSNGGSVDAQPWTLSGVAAAQDRWAKQKLAMG